MKVLAILVFGATAFSQSLSSSASISSNSSVTTSSSSEDVTTVTSYYPGCSTLSVGNYSTTSTTTGTVTETLPCHECQMTNGVYTTYTTVYTAICPTGLAPSTYVITEQCSETGQPRPTNYIPQGFTVTTVACGACVEETIILTTPAGSATSTPVPVITLAPMNTSTVCHTCNQTITSIQYGEGVSLSLGLSIFTLFASIAAALILL